MIENPHNAGSRDTDQQTVQCECCEASDTDVIEEPAACHRSEHPENNVAHDRGGGFIDELNSQSTQRSTKHNPRE
jgi:hypothetical protein